MRKNWLMILLGFGLMVPTMLWLVMATVCYYQFEIGCGQRLKRAADANTIDLATTEMDAAVGYLLDHKMTEGYTSIFWNSPDEDVGFWYKNLAASLDELKKVSPDASQLERSNILMKLRQTLLDHSGEHGEVVTAPEGISRFPDNAFWLKMAILFFPFCLVGAFLILIEFVKDE